MRKSTHVKTTRKVIVEKTIDSTVLFKLTLKYKHSEKCNDKKRRNYLLYFLNDVLILKQKSPYDETYQMGHGNRTYMNNTYLFNGNLHQERSLIYNAVNPRKVKYPISKIRLHALNVPPDLKIPLSDIEK
jgi:hypothetical protein